ncbi:MAG: polysaccharide biosynthesis tyrosine autokinase [Proteobacteria bacterium]|nr:polysaccharide biosynthesis tyrosine autokinase [Pseudomonadota bacterium]
MMSQDDSRKNPISQLPANLPYNSGELVDPRLIHLGAQPGDYADAFSSEEVPLREYLRVLFKYRMIIGAIILASVVLSLIYAFTATPQYTASSKIRISTYQPVLSAMRIEDILTEKSKESNYIETQIEELRSFSLADKVLRDPQILKYFADEVGEKVKDIPPSGQADYQTSLPVIRAYLNAIQINPLRRTSLVSINVSADDPAFAALVAGRHSNAYIEWVRTTRVEQQARALKFLREQADELRERVADLERELADYAEANAIVAVNKDENIVAQKMAQVNQLLTEVNGKRLEAENLYRQADAAKGEGSAGFDDISVQNLRSELAKAEAEYQQLSAKFMPGYPKMVELSSQIKGLKRSISEQRRQVVVGLKAKAEALIEQEKGLKEELEQQKSRAFELSKKQVQYNSLNRELASSRELLENVLKQIKETGLSVESNASNISIVDAPVVPLYPSFPRKKLVVAMGLFLGCLLGVAVAFLLNYMDNSIKTPQDVAYHLRLPSLGVVPSFGLEKPSAPAQPVEGASESTGSEVAAGPVSSSNVPEVASAAANPVMFIREPRSLAAEAYRTIRTGLLLSRAGEPPRKILVTSAQSGEGKTTSSANLASSLASSGGRVVLIDADLRRPSIYKQFQLDPSLPGLVDILTGQRRFEEVAITDCIKRVTVVPSGKIPPNPAELVGSFEMLELLDRLASKYDYVIVDSPPILPVTDSVVLSRFVDGVLLVVRGGATPRRVVADAKARLTAAGARVFGAVLNDVDITGGDHDILIGDREAVEDDPVVDDGTSDQRPARRAHDGRRNAWGVRLIAEVAVVEDRRTGTGAGVGHRARVDETLERVAVPDSRGRPLDPA